MSAKSGEGVNLCFQKIAAELLGIRLVIIYEYGIFIRFLISNLDNAIRCILVFCICFRLTKAEQEHHQKVVRAEIVTYPQNRIPSNPQSTVKTAVCSLQ